MGGRITVPVPCHERRSARKLRRLSIIFLASGTSELDRRGRLDQLTPGCALIGKAVAYPQGLVYHVGSRRA